MFKKSIYGMLFFSLIFVGCGTDSVGGKFTGTISGEKVEEIAISDSSLEPVLKTGVLLDSTVSGINYKTTSGVEGATNNAGEYEYYNGDLVEFFVGEVLLGEVEAKELITTDDFSYPLQVAQFLQTIDYDNFTENGIQIDRRLHSNYLLEKATPKDDNSSLFARELNIQDFSASAKNNIFIEELMNTSRLKYRRVVPELIALEHAEKAKRLKNIGKNSSKFYHEITEINITTENNGLDINSTIQHTTLTPRLIYNFYQRAYRSGLVQESEIGNSSLFSNQLATDYTDSYLNITDMIIETLLYTNSSKRDVTREIINQLNNIPNKNSAITDIAISCLSSISFDEDNKSKESQKVISCIDTNIHNASINYVSTLINHPNIAKQNQLAMAYLDLYLSCGSQDESCLLNVFDNNDTMDSQLWFTVTKNKIYSDDTAGLFFGAKGIISNYINIITGLVNSVSEGLPKDSFLNKTEIDLKKVSIVVNPLEIKKDEENTILWVAIDVDNKTGADINITSFKQTVTMDNKEFVLYNSHKYTTLDQTYAASNRAINLVAPIFIDGESLPQNGEAKLTLKMNYLAEDNTFQAIAETTVDINLNQLWSASPLEQFNKNSISLSKNMEIVEEKKRYYLPTVKIGLNKLDIENIEWSVPLNDVTIKRDDNGFYVYHMLEPDANSEIKFLKVLDKSDVYSKSTIFVLNIIKRKEIISTEETTEENKHFLLTLENIREYFYKKLDAQECKEQRWQIWRNLAFALREELSSEVNIMKSIQGCLRVQKLVEEEEYSYSRAVGKVRREDNSVFSID